MKIENKEIRLTLTLKLKHWKTLEGIIDQWCDVRADDYPLEVIHMRLLLQSISESLPDMQGELI